MKIGSIEKIMLLKGFSKDWMATQLDMSERQLSRYISGESEWTLALLEQVAKLFEMTVPQVLSFDEKMFFQHCNGLVGVNNNSTYNGMSDKAHELYEARIKELEEVVAELRKDKLFLQTQLAAAQKER
ncbi:MAG: helix-turn-helix transcriptional regulator [Bacteroidetes bacterium]|nr:helix-turn-helix transcriptional regulator [Bacteroidota bacterium]